MKKHHIVSPNSQRKLRRHIQLALAGAALGTVFVAMPSRAATVSVTNTSSSGVGSLNKAIIDSNLNGQPSNIVEFSGVSSGSTFSGSLPSITNDLTIDNSITGTANLNNFTVNAGLTTDTNDGELYLYGDGSSTVTSDLTAKGSSYIYVNDYNVNGNLAADGEDNSGNQSWIDVSNSTVNGGTIKASNGGGVDIYNGSNVTLTGDVTADGVGIDGDVSEIDVESGSTLAANNLNITNGGYVYVDGATVNLTGNATVDGVTSNSDYSEIDLYNSAALNIGGNLNLTNGGYLYMDGSALTVDGDIKVDGVGINDDGAELYVYGGQVNATNLKVSNGAYSYFRGGAIVTLTGDVTVDGLGSNGDSSEVDVSGGSTLAAKNLNITNGGYVDIYDSATVNLTGDLTVDGEDSNGDESRIDVNDSTLTGVNLNLTRGGQLSIDNSNVTFTGDAIVDGATSGGDSTDLNVDNASTFSAKTLTVTNGGSVDIDGSTANITEDAVVNGMNSDGYRSQIELWNSSHLQAQNLNVTNGGYVGVYDNSVFDLGATGTATASSGGVISLNNGYIYGNVTINDSALLRNQGNSELNDGLGVTTFSNNATFAPDVMSSPLFVDQLSLDNSKLQPWFSNPGALPASLPIGSANYLPVLEYNSHTGSFDPAVRSPLNVGITDMNTGGSTGEIQVYLIDNNINFNRLPGSENAHSAGAYLSDFANATQSDTPGAPLNVAALTTGSVDFVDLIGTTSYDGNLSSFDADMPDNYSAHNTQAYWNQKAFVDSIRANLQNDRNTESGPAGSFALNQSSSVGQAGGQLATLRQAMTSNAGALNYAGAGSNSSSVWASYNGNHQHTDADGGVGSHDWSSSTNGFTVGYTAGGDRFRWGVAAGHQDSDLNIDTLGARGTQRGYNVGLFGALTNKSSYLNGILGYGKYDNETFGGLGDTQFKNKALSASLEIGKHLSNDKKGGFTPYASVLWTRIQQDDATIVPGPLGVILNGGSNSVFTTELGVRYNHRMFDPSGALKGGWQAGLAWLHQGGDTGLPANIGLTEFPGSFGVKSTPLAGNSAVVQLGAYGRIHNRLIGFAGYQGTFGSSQKINAVNAGVGYQF